MYYTTEHPRNCPRQARRAYTYEPTDYRFERRTPKEWGHVYFTQERRKRRAVEFAVEIVLSVLFAVAVAALVTLK